MTDEQNYFIQILSDHLNGRKSKACPGLDWDALHSYAKIHQVSGILYHQCSAWLPEEHKTQLQELHAAELFFYYNRVALMEQILEDFTREKIPYYTVKGLNVAALYPVPTLRTMGDSDIIVHPEDKERAHVRLLALGFTNYHKDSAEWMYDKNDIHVELHAHLLYDQPANTADDRKTVDTAWEHAYPKGEGSQYALDWSFHFLFLLLHLKKHLVQQGVGFRQFMDLAIVSRTCELDWSWIESQLNALGLRRFAQTCFALLERWFSVPQPMEPIQLDADFCEKVAEVVFANGVFGHNNGANEGNAWMRAITNKGGSRLGNRISLVRAYLFPAYRDMVDQKPYAFLKGNPWLLPVTWIYRYYITP